MSVDETLKLRSDLENKSKKLVEIWVEYNRDFDSVELFYKRLLEIQNLVSQGNMSTHTNSIEDDIQYMIEQCDKTINNLENSYEKLKSNSKDENYQKFIKEATQLRLLIRNERYLEIIISADQKLTRGTIKEEDKDIIKKFVSILPKLDSGFSAKLFEKARLVLNAEENQKVFTNEELASINEVLNNGPKVKK